jgi:hypothetical protein
MRLPMLWAGVLGVPGLGTLVNVGKDENTSRCSQRCSLGVPSISSPGLPGGEHLPRGMEHLGNSPRCSTENRVNAGSYASGNTWNTWNTWNTFPRGSQVKRR